MRFQVNVCYCHGSYTKLRVVISSYRTHMGSQPMCIVYTRDLRRIYSIRNGKKRHRKDQSRCVVDTRPKSFCRSENIRHSFRSLPSVTSLPPRSGEVDLPAVKLQPRAVGVALLASGNDRRAVNLFATIVTPFTLPPG